MKNTAVWTVSGRPWKKVAAIKNADESFKHISESLSTAFFQLQEAASDIYSELDGLEYDEERLNEIEERLNFIQQLKRKYGQLCGNDPGSF
ncbi:MAG: hypothetical protein U5K84_05440 [Alkalibacterium sp.]|nr:hypothetical protein [Alkalibacterium sp.]